MAAPTWMGWARQAAAKLWAIDETALDALLARMAQVDGQAADRALAAAVTDDRMSGASTIAIIPMFGEIYPRESVMSYYFGGAVVERMRAQLRKALADDTVKAIVFRIDSPGGMVDGVPEFADEILAARSQKPIVAMVDAGMAASAAYWLASQMTSISVSSSSQVGSIGVVALHLEYARMLEEDGVTPTILRSAPAKMAANPYETLPDETRAEMQAMVDTVAGQFRAAVARGRGVTPAVVRETYGEGRVFLAADAKRLGLVDRIETFDQLLARASTLKVRPTARAEAEAGVMQASADDETGAPVVDAPPTFIPAVPPTETPQAANDQARADADYLAARLALRRHHG